MENNVIRGYGTAAGTDTYTVNLSVRDSILFNPGIYIVTFTNANTGASTLNVNSIGASAIVGSDGAALTAGNITAGRIYTLLYNGTNFAIVGVDQSGVYEVGSGTDSVQLIGDGTNSAASDFSGSLSGEDNDIDANSPHSVVAGGDNNDMTTAPHSGILSGENNNLDDATHSAILAGNDARIADTFSAGDLENVVVLGGENFDADRHDTVVQGGGNTAGTMDSKWESMMLSVTTTDATQTELLGPSGSAAAKLFLKNTSIVMFEAKVIGHQTGGASGTAGDSYVQMIRGAIKRSGAGAVAFVGTPDTYFQENDAATVGFDVSVVAGTDRLEVQVTGEASKNVDWSCVLRYLEIRS